MYSGEASTLLEVKLLGDCFVLIEPCVLGPLCVIRDSDRVNGLAAKEVLHLSLPGRAERVTKGHQGPSEAQLRLASSLVGSGVGVWTDMDQLVAGEPSLAALRDNCAQAILMLLVLLACSVLSYYSV